jgi:hypothetical protein
VRSNASHPDRGRNRPVKAVADDAYGASVLRLLRRSPRDAVGFVIGTVATIAILINALFMQPSSHPAPMFKGAAVAARPVASSDHLPAAAGRPRQFEPAAINAGAPPRTLGAVSKGTTAGTPAVRPRSITNTVVTERPMPSTRVIALQRALAEYGYGQIKPSGIVDAETQAAIQKFERERKLPISGQASERVVREMAAVTGRALE